MKLTEGVELTFAVVQFRSDRFDREKRARTSGHEVTVESPAD